MTGRALLLLCCLAASPLPARAQSAQCGARDTIVAVLADRYGETRRAMGLSQNAVMEVYASTETGTWTLAVTTPDGTMCLVAAGQGYEQITEPLPARGARI